MDYRSSPPMVAPIAFRPHPTTTSYTHHYESNKAPVMPRFQLGYPDIDYPRFNHHHQPTWAENSPYHHAYYTSRSPPYPVQTTAASSSTRLYPITIN
jgi:hypothetical protein